ncbi:hypothetical protein BH18ACI4_BH18ACI4_07240 [soil metagenome]
MKRCQTLSPLGAPPLQNQPAILACHPGAKAMGLCSTPVVWLKSGLGHCWISLPRENGKTNCRWRLCQERQNS